MVADVNINISANTVAWYGAIIATIGFIFGTYNILRDRARIKVWYSWDNFIIGGFGNDDKSYLRVDVTNLGRRPVKITHVAAKLHSTNHTLLLTSSFQKQNEDRILTEQNPSTYYLAEQEELDQKDVWYIYAVEARGKEYRAYPSLRDRFMFWLTFPKSKVTRVKQNSKKAKG